METTCEASHPGHCSGGNSPWSRLCLSLRTKTQIHDLRNVTLRKKHLHLPLALVMTETKINTSFQISSYKIIVVLLFTLY